ncbi:CoxG family protein [Rubellimicrobium sp. CFH 75288]|uniref:CoxG family protein n=1 Tax=Rubellimicrobium sp. CFH 75288 TaxID=2697034 RepID=UPI00141245E4|nr:carbon monoxide dehydrogenase subunit G [Rubellimicrobium sp. CFH 75288]NAZ36057.1 carbon monoxide dehydrogenase [Rubellimicrobium sp. CFH 75288]
MELAGQRFIAADPERVWQALIDPVFLKDLIPGCQSMRGDPQNGYDITAERGVGGFTARLTGRIDLEDVRPGEGAFLRASGEGTGVGAAQGTARISLAPEGAGTRLSWTVAARVGGRLAALPGFAVEMAARRVADGFVERFAAALEGREPRRGWIARLAGG